jgi:hypothetical protein
MALVVPAVLAAFFLVPGLGHADKCSATPSGTGTTLPSLDGHTNVVVNHYTYVGGQGSSSQRSGAIYGNVGTSSSQSAGFYFGGDDNAPTAAQGCIQAGSICFAVPSTQCDHT